MNLKVRQPFWSCHFQFCDFDFKFVFNDPKNLAIQDLAGFGKLS